MKILLITSPNITGLNYHRQLAPFRAMDLEYEERPVFNIEWEDSFLTQFDCVSFLRQIDLDGNTPNIIKRLKKLGIKIHFDIDDLWELPSTHPLYKSYKNNNLPEQIEEAIKGSDLVTTSTIYLAAYISELNENVEILPNAINPDEEQWKITEIDNDRLRLGYIAVDHHLDELEILYPNIKKLWKCKDIYNKWQLCPAGFNIVNRDGKQMMNVYYNHVEKIFTNNYRFIKDKEYKEYLRLNNPQDNEQTFDREYRRLWGLDTFNYAKLYDLIDVSLAPLKENKFSRCKSELKVIEAGFKKKAIIVSNVKPYTLVANKDNSVLVNSTRNHIDWFISMRRLIKEPNLREDIAEQLHEDVKDIYHIDTVNKVRKQLLIKLCE